MQSLCQAEGRAAYGKDPHARIERRGVRRAGGNPTVTFPVGTAMHTGGSGCPPHGNLDEQFPRQSVVKDRFALSLYPSSSVYYAIDDARGWIRCVWCMPSRIMTHISGAVYKKILFFYEKSRSFIHRDMLPFRLRSQFTITGARYSMAGGRFKWIL